VEEKERRNEDRLKEIYGDTINLKSKAMLSKERICLSLRKEVGTPFGLAQAQVTPCKFPLIWSYSCDLM
jgi:hypothetical protein